MKMHIGWRRAAVATGTTVLGVALAMGTAYAGPINSSDPHFQSGTNGVAGSNGAAKQIDEGLGGKGGLLTSLNFGYGLTSVDFPGAAKLSDLSHLAAQYSMTQGTCAGGAPRFHISVQAPDHSVVRLDDNFNTAATPSSTATSNFGGCSGAGPYTEVDVTTTTSSDWQVNVGNSFFTWSQILATYGSDKLLHASIVLDGGWANPGLIQQMLIQKWQVNGKTFFPLPH